MLCRKLDFHEIREVEIQKVWIVKKSSETWKIKIFQNPILEKTRRRLKSIGEKKKIRNNGAAVLW